MNSSKQGTILKPLLFTLRPSSSTLQIPLYIGKWTKLGFFYLHFHVLKNKILIGYWNSSIECLNCAFSCFRLAFYLFIFFFFFSFSSSGLPLIRNCLMLCTCGIGLSYFKLFVRLILYLFGNCIRLNITDARVSDLTWAKSCDRMAYVWWRNALSSSKHLWYRHES